MKSRKFYRDGLEENISGPIKVRLTSDGHTVERYTLENGNKKYFVTLAGTHWCAHGDTEAQAIADAIWKDESRRPSMESLKRDILKEGKLRKLSLNEFRLLTGACLSGCRAALAKAKRDESPMTAHEIRDGISREWGNKLLLILGWES
jgi:hypothetical protein